MGRRIWVGNIGGEDDECVMRSLGGCNEFSFSCFEMTQEAAWLCFFLIYIQNGKQWIRYNLGGREFGVGSPLVARVHHMVITLTLVRLSMNTSNLTIPFTMKRDILAKVASEWPG